MLASFFEHLKFPHYIYLMHTENNIDEALWSTIMDTETMKDNIRARLDQQQWCDRSKINLQPLGVKTPQVV
jgi:hypothetical protein